MKTIAVALVALLAIAAFVASANDMQRAEEFLAQLTEESKVRSTEAKREREMRGIWFGTGFFVTADGYFVTNHHVIGENKHVVLFTTDGGRYNARIVRLDRENDLAILKAEGTFVAVPVAGSRSVKRGQAVGALGFPHPNVMGVEPKVTNGTITSLTGFGGNRREFQVSPPVQSGNSGGPMFDMFGNVIGIIFAKANAAYMTEKTGDTIQLVNYAIKSDRLIEMMLDAGLEKKLPAGLRTIPQTLEGATEMVERSIAWVAASKSPFPAEK